jgi:hypothetical protein
MQFYHVQIPLIKCIIRSAALFTCCLFLFSTKTSISLPVVITDDILTFRANRSVAFYDKWQIRELSCWKLQCTTAKSYICNPQRVSGLKYWQQTFFSCLPLYRVHFCREFIIQIVFQMRSLGGWRTEKLRNWIIKNSLRAMMKIGQVFSDLMKKWS